MAITRSQIARQLLAEGVSLDKVSKWEAMLMSFVTCYV